MQDLLETKFKYSWAGQLQGWGLNQEGGSWFSLRAASVVREPALSAPGSAGAAAALVWDAWVPQTLGPRENLPQGGDNVAITVNETAPLQRCM